MLSLYVNKCKKLQFIHKLTASDTSKTAKNHKKVILLSCTLTFRRCAGGLYHLFVVFAVLDVLLAVNLCINCSFFTFINV